MEDKSHIDYDLIAKFLSNNTSEQENQLLNKWRAASEANEIEFEALKSIWLATDDHEKIDTEGALTNVLSQISNESQNGTQFSWYSLAAAILVLFTVGSAIWYLSRQDMRQFRTGAEMANITLSDGSEIILNTQSLLEYPEAFDAETRTVSFTGQGYFKIQANPNKPFIINTEAGDIRVVGTAFEIDTKQEEFPLQVKVEEGVVQVSSNSSKSSEKVVAGEEVRLNRENKLSVTQTKEIAPFFWRNKTIRFRRTPMVDVAETLHELFGMEIQFKDQGLENCQLTATFEDEVPDVIMDVIAATLELELKKEGEVYTLSGTGC